MALYVTAVDENSPAERFGLTVGWPSTVIP